MNYHSIIFKIGELDKEIIEEKSSKHKHNEGHCYRLVAIHHPPTFISHFARFHEDLRRALNTSRRKSSGRKDAITGTRK